MYRSLNRIMTGVVSLGLAALTFVPSAGAQRSSGPRPATTTTKPATTTTKPATTAAKPAATADKPATTEAAKPEVTEAAKPATTAAAKPSPKAPATKQRANKWVLGAHTIAAPGVSIAGPGFDPGFSVSTTMGGGLGIMAGYELNKVLTAFASLDVAKQNSGQAWMSGSFGLVHAELGIRAKLSQANTQSVPYVMAAIGRRALGSRISDFDEGQVYDMSFSGMMLSFGGGMEYRLSPKLALDGGLELGIGAFDHYDVDGELGSINVNTSTSVRVRAGVVWRP